MSASSSTATEMQVTLRQRMGGHTGWVQRTVHLPGGRHIITCSEDGSLRLWDMDNGAQIGDDWRDEGIKAGVLAMALSPNGKTVASGNSDKTVRLWDVETGKVIARWRGHTENVLSVCWSPDGGRVVSGSRDGAARVWNVESGIIALGPMKTGHKTVYAVAYSPDQKKIATGGDNENSVKIWDSESGELLSSTVKQYESVWSLAWSSDGKTLISGGNIRSIRIFDTATWQQIAILSHENISSVTLSHNDRLLASASWDRTARLWNLDTYLQVGLPLQHENDVNCAAFSADGTLLVTACKDGNVYVWDIREVSDADATPNSPKLQDTRRLSKVFVEVPQDVDSSATDGAQPQSSAPYRTGALESSPVSRTHTLFGRISSFFCSSRRNTLTEQLKSNKDD